MGVAVVVVVLCGRAPGRAQEASVEVWTESSLRKVFRDEGRPALASAALALTAVRNEYESGQVVARAGSQPLRGLEGSVADLRSESGEVLPSAAVELYWVRYVEVRVPSQNRVTQPGWWPDPLVPVAAVPRVDVSVRQNQPLWVAVHVPATCVAGRYRGPLSLRDQRGPLATVPLEVHVSRVLLPQRPTLRATAALYYPAVRDWLNAHCRTEGESYAEGSDEWAQVQRRYYEFLLRYRLCGYELPVPVESAAADAYLTDPRVHSFRLPWRLDEPDYFRPLVDRLRRLGVLGKAFYYQADEPVPAQHEDIRELGRKLHKYAAGLPQLVTHRPIEPLFGAVDIWCPDLGDANSVGHLDFAELAARQRQGESVWWYTCCVPTYPYPTWLVDDAAVCPRVFCWMMALHDIQGFVYSMVHGWGEDPFAHVTSFATTNGDGLLIYPGEVFGSSDPLPSLRLMLLRDGIEDYELLRILTREQARVARALGSRLPGDDPSKSLCSTLIRGLTDFERDPERLTTARALLVGELAAIGDRPLMVATARAVGVRHGAQRVQVEGVADKLAWVRIEDAPVATSRDSAFRQVVELPTGSTTIAATIRNRGRTKTVHLPIRPLPAEPKPPVPRDIPRSEAAPTLDGQLTETAWDSALVVPLEHQQNGLSPASLTTQVRLLWLDESLYFAFEAELFPPEKYPDRDNLRMNWVALRLDPGATHDRYYFLVFTAKGNVHREVRTRNGRQQSDVPTCQSEVRVTGNRFVVEGALSLRELFAGDLPGRLLGMNLLRRSRDELDAFTVPPDDVTQFAPMRLH